LPPSFGSSFDLEPDAYEPHLDVDFTKLSPPGQDQARLTRRVLDPQ
jgi:hypothetical protein